MLDDVRKIPIDENKDGLGLEEQEKTIGISSLSVFLRNSPIRQNRIHTHCYYRNKYSAFSRIISCLATKKRSILILRMLAMVS